MKFQHECEMGFSIDETSEGNAAGYEGIEGRGVGNSYGKFFEGKAHIQSCGFGEGGAAPGYEKDDGTFDGEGEAEFSWDANLNGAGQALGGIHGDDDRPEA